MNEPGISYLTATTSVNNSRSVPKINDLFHAELLTSKPESFHKALVPLVGPTSAPALDQESVQKMVDSGVSYGLQPILQKLDTVLQ